MQAKEAGGEDIETMGESRGQGEEPVRTDTRGHMAQDQGEPEREAHIGLKCFTPHDV